MIFAYLAVIWNPIDLSRPSLLHACMIQKRAAHPLLPPVTENFDATQHASSNSSTLGPTTPNLKGHDTNPDTCCWEVFILGKMQDVKSAFKVCAISQLYSVRSRTPSSRMCFSETHRLNCRNDYTGSCQRSIYSLTLRIVRQS